MATNMQDLLADVTVAQAIGIDIPNGMSLGDGDSMRMTSNTDEKIIVYSTINGEPKPILKNDAMRVLKKRRPDGQLAHWIPGMPGNAPEYKKGNIKCMLHPEFDETDGPSRRDRAWIDKIGLSGQFCNMMNMDKPPRADFRSVFDRDDHMAKRHQRELSIIRAAEGREYQDKDSDDRKADREAILRLVENSVTPRTKKEA